jgi:hypothetical protein
MDANTRDFEVELEAQLEEEKEATRISAEAEVVSATAL